MPPTIRSGIQQQLRCLRQLAKPQLAATQWQPTLAIRAPRRQLTTEDNRPDKGNTDPQESMAAEVGTQVPSQVASQTESADSSAGPADSTDSIDFKPRAQAKETKIQAAPELTSIKPPPEHPFQGDVTKWRPLPVSPSYFSRTPRFNDAVVRLTTLLNRYHHLPVAKSDEIPRVLWQTLGDFRLTIGEPIKALAFSRALLILKRLHQIHPKVMPREVKDALNEFQRDFDPLTNLAKPIPVDRFGRALGVGRRKTSTARAWVVEGTGEVLINGKPLSEAFGRIHDRESAIWALRSTDRSDKYNVWALVEGGGTTGQAEALTLAIAKAMLAHEPALKKSLRQAGCITRDPRTVERKKHGHVKSRKMPAWVKR